MKETTKALQVKVRLIAATNAFFASAVSRISRLRREFSSLFEGSVHDGAKALFECLLRRQPEGFNPL